MAVRAAVAPFEEEIFPDLGASQGPLLILYSGDSRVLQELGIKAYRFERERIDWTPASQALHPGDDMLHPTLQRRGQPPSRSCPVGKAGGTIAGVPLTPRTTDGTALRERLVDLLTPVGQFPSPHHLTGTCLRLPSGGRSS